MTSDTAPATLDDLTVKQAAFLDAYLACGNASEAYRCAYDAENMLPNTIHRAAWQVLEHPKVSAMLRERRAAAQSAVDATILASRVASMVSLGRLERIAAMNPEDDPRALPSIKGANETLLGIAEVIPKAGTVVDARSITVNMGGRDPRLAGYSLEQLSAIIEELEAREAGSGAVEALGEPGG